MATRAKAKHQENPTITEKCSQETLHYLPLYPFCIQVLTSPPRTLASKKIVKDPNIQIVIIQETTLRDKEQFIYINHFYCKKEKLISINPFHCSQGFYYAKLNPELRQE